MVCHSVFMAVDMIRGNSYYCLRTDNVSKKNILGLEQLIVQNYSNMSDFHNERQSINVSRHLQKDAAACTLFDWFLTKNHIRHSLS